MQLIEYKDNHNIDDIFIRRINFAKTFDPSSNCYDYLKEKLTIQMHGLLLIDNQTIQGIAIIEILDKYYGNLILHTFRESDEALLADLMVPIIKGHVL